MTKRWGKPFKDSRDWVKYNEELVVRGKFLLELGWVKSWDKELEGMNKGKRGAQYEFPESLIKLQGLWHQWVDYRGVEGITRKLVEHGNLPKYNDFSTINRRVRKLDVGIELPKHGTVDVSTDGSGMKMTNSGEYRQRKYGKKKRKGRKKGKGRKNARKRHSRKRYLKVTITADPVRKKLLDCDVSIEGEGPSEPETAKNHMGGLIDGGKKIRKFWGDGGFDSNDLFDFCEENGIESAIKIRKDAVPDREKSKRRAKEVEEYQGKGYKKWARKKKYGRRWTGTEGIFSAVKRKFGENVRSRKLCNICHEAKAKFWAYDRMKSYAEAAVM